ncbi:MAG: hypothetical protein L3J74_17545 [Bacteroidales bacterium]|nr:hypothetical protein [Bacteroidales bacterium]
MKTKFIFFIVLLISIKSNAQVIIIPDDYQFSQLMRPNLVTNTNYEDIAGSPYLDKNFTESILYFKNDSAFKLPLRYNIFDQRFEYQHKGQVYSIDNPADIKRLEMDNRIFIYYNSKHNYEYNGYYQLLAEGKAILLLKREVVYREAEKSNGIVEPKPDRFLHNPDKYYVVVASHEPKLLKNRKSIAQIFEDNVKKMETFAKKEKISFKKQADLIGLVNYYNRLQTN